MGKNNQEKPIEEPEWPAVRKRYGTSFRISPEAHRLAKFVAASEQVSISGFLNDLIIRQLRPLASDYSRKFLNGDRD